jgi:hypothetical protein
VGNFEVEDGFLIIQPSGFQTLEGCLPNTYGSVLDRFSGG